MVLEACPPSLPLNRRPSLLRAFLLIFLIAALVSSNPRQAYLCPPQAWGMGKGPLNKQHGGAREHRHARLCPCMVAAPAKAADMSLGAPGCRPKSGAWRTPAGVEVTSTVEHVEDVEAAFAHLAARLDMEKGAVLTSSYEFPGRYARWSIGFAAPALQIQGTGFEFSISALNSRGKVLSAVIKHTLARMPHLFRIEQTLEEEHTCKGIIIPSHEYFSEEERSKQPSLFSLVRAILEAFSSEDSGQLGLYGAFGYDLTFQFEPIRLFRPRHDQRDVVLFFPDELLVADNDKKDAWRVSFEFDWNGLTTRGLARTSSEAEFYVPPELAQEPFERRDCPMGEYSKLVERAKHEFKVGNLFEVVLSQTFREKCSNTDSPSSLFKRLSNRNPSPYGFLFNLGENEFLVGASPEMFVRCERTAQGLRIETCPISGTIARGANALEDAAQIQRLLSNPKEESELTMCTDVDRNDKSRICLPGSVKVLGRRQIELYSRLIHTVDHVEGYLRPGFDALDAFLGHTWAVTVTGAPKTWAIRFIEEQEKSSRHWYGGAVGIVGFDGSLNTGLTLRTVRIKNGVAEVRAGATLLFDSLPEAEEAETELKASAMLDALTRRSDDADSAAQAELSELTTKGLGKKVILVDHEDSFVHTLGNYLRQTGADVTTCRSGEPFRNFLNKAVDSGSFVPDLVVLSPGPGTPTDFDLTRTIDALIKRRIPMFGVCLGLQGLVEHFGGELGILPSPMHGKPSEVAKVIVGSELQTQNVLQGIPDRFQVARYHSLYGLDAKMPADLIVTARSADGVAMAVQHSKWPIAAVQFHPESILTSHILGMKILANAVTHLTPEMYDS